MKINISLTFNIKSERLKENILKMIISVNEVDEEEYKPIFFPISNNRENFFIFR